MSSPEVEPIPFAAEERFYSGDLNGQVTLRDGTGKWPLISRSYLHNYSAPFEWGHDGAGAAQLSLALLADALDDDARALQLHGEFKDRVVVDLPKRWTITRSRIRAHARVIEAVRAHASSGAKPDRT